jgi:hypothetical protein
LIIFEKKKKMGQDSFIAVNQDPTSSKLWIVSRLYSGEEKEEHAGAYWDQSPDVANTYAMSLWKEFSPQWMDSQDNVDGADTKKGEPYQSFSCVDCGADSLSINVDEYHISCGLGIRALKAILKCRGLSIDVDGRKGKQAKQLLQDRLDAYMKELTSSENPGQSDSSEAHSRFDKMISS